MWGEYTPSFLDHKGRQHESVVGRIEEIFPLESEGFAQYMVVALGFDGLDCFARVVDVIYSVIAVYGLQRIGIRLLVQPGIEESGGSAVHVDFHAPKLKGLISSGKVYSRVMG